jgi:hypothetical protein
LESASGMDAMQLTNAKALNVQFVLGLGDIVNNGSDRTQYANADASYRVLDNARFLTSPRWVITITKTQRP